VNPGRGPDPYEVLNVPRTATQSEIRAAYQVLVTKYHPDLYQGNPLEDLASARLQEINQAYEILSDETRRAAYDAGAGADASAQRQPGRVDPRTSKRLMVSLAFLVVVRLGAVAIRALGVLARDLFEATASAPGGRPTVVAAVALAVIGLALLRRRRRR
jgi:MYXO-CTERM domain-containing protein